IGGIDVACHALAAGAVRASPMEKAQRLRLADVENCIIQVVDVSRCNVAGEVAWCRRKAARGWFGSSPIIGTVEFDVQDLDGPQPCLKGDQFLSSARGVFFHGACDAKGI